MKKLVLISLISCFIFSSLFAQEGVFSVILNKGENTYREGTTTNPVLLGTSLSENDVLNVADGGYVALVHEATGSSLELTTDGDYSVKEMEQMISDQSSTVLAKYGKFLMNKLNPEDDGNQNLNVTGAVERGEEGLIKIYWPSVMDVYGDEAIVTWQQTDDIKDYIVTIKNMFDEVIDEKPVTGTTFKMVLDKGKLKDEKLMIINVRAKGNEGVYSRDYGIKRLSPEVKESIRKEFENLKMVANTENALNKLLFASFFEENQLLVDAITYYNQALVISPDPDGFTKLYDNFLQRNGLK